MIEEFQTGLASTVPLPSSTFSSLKIADLFDGRLFAFTLEQLGQPSKSKVNFDSTTREIVHRSLAVLQIPSSDHLMEDVVQELIKSKDITFVSSSASADKSEPIEEWPLMRISNPFVDAVLKPILSPSVELTLKFIDPSDQKSSRYLSKHHWHVYKPVGDEINRIRDNDQESKSTSPYRFRTSNQQKS